MSTAAPPSSPSRFPPCVSPLSSISVLPFSVDRSTPRHGLAERRRAQAPLSALPIARSCASGPDPPVCVFPALPEPQVSLVAVLLKPLRPLLLPAGHDQFLPASELPCAAGSRRPRHPLVAGGRPRTESLAIASTFSRASMDAMSPASSATLRSWPDPTGWASSPATGSLVGAHLRRPHAPA